MTIPRFLLAAAAGSVFGFWALLMLLGFGEGSLHLDATDNGEFVPMYFLMIYAPPVIIAALSFLSLRKGGKPGRKTETSAG